MITTGDKVRHPKMPDWGLGKVMEVTSDGKARIFFIHAGEKTILLSRVDFEKVEGEEAAHPILDNLKVVSISWTEVTKFNWTLGPDRDRVS